MNKEKVQKSSIQTIVDYLNAQATVAFGGKYCSYKEHTWGHSVKTTICYLYNESEYKYKHIADYSPTLTFDSIEFITELARLIYGEDDYWYLEFLKDWVPLPEQKRIHVIATAILDIQS